MDESACIVDFLGSSLELRRIVLWGYGVNGPLVARCNSDPSCASRPKWRSERMVPSTFEVVLNGTLGSSVEACLRGNDDVGVEHVYGFRVEIVGRGIDESDLGEFVGIMKLHGDITMLSPMRNGDV